MICIGDSITAGEGVKREECYVELLKAKAQAEHLKLEVIGQGRSGWSTGGYVGARKNMQAAMPADATIISVMLGTNDSHESGTQAEIRSKAGENLKKLIDMYREKAPGAQFVIVLPPKQYPAALSKRLVDAHYGDTSVTNLKEVSAAFKAVATERGLLCIDLSEVPSSANKTKDGIHPDAAGHQEIFEALWEGITRAAPAARP